MEFITIFCLLLTLGLVLWIFGVAVLFVIKVIIGICGIPFLRGRISSDPKEPAEAPSSKTKEAVKVSFSSDNSFYLIGEDPEGRKVKRYSDNNTIFRLYKENSLYLSTVENQRMGQRMDLETTDAADMIHQMESCFYKWSIGDPGHHFSYAHCGACFRYNTPGTP